MSLNEHFMVSLIRSCSLAEAFTAFIIICSIVFWWMCVSFHFLCYSLVSLVHMPYSSGDWWQGWGESCFLSTWTQPHNHLTTRTCKTHIHTHTSKLRIYCDSFLYVSVSFTGSQSAQLRATLCIIINRKTFFFFSSARWADIWGRGDALHSWHEWQRLVEGKMRS